ncbi:hypothetical protein [Sulfurisphaera ohwakuensis]|uniref:hypothetical protein n=1 Tax=Sulfurisphaera ohwakuensis TaxID=69656 RepID=UPI0036F2A513
MWYRHELKYNTNASEKFIVDMLEYLAKAFTLLNPQNRDEAIYFLALLEDAYAVADYVMELIDRIYANRNTNMMVREL